MAVSNVNRNKSIVADFCEVFSSGDVDAILSFFEDTAVWRIMGGMSSSGDYDMIRFREFVETVGTIVEGGRIEFTLVGTVAEGDSVAAEITSQAVFTNGRKYTNEYHWYIEIRDGKIRHVREYQDTAHVVEMLAP